jgi:hypothetical protein
MVLTTGSVDPSLELLLDSLDSFFADEIKNMGGHFVLFHPWQDEPESTQKYLSGLFHE